MTPRIAAVARATSAGVLALCLVAALGGDRLTPLLPANTTLAALLLGARATVATALVVLGGTLGVGVVLGAASGVGPRLFDSALSRSVETAGSLPSLVTALAIAKAAPVPSPIALGLVLALLRGLALAKAIRAEIRALSASDFAIAARALGSGETRLFVTHLLPHVVPTAVASALLASATAVTLESALSFLGLGGAGPSWGALLADGIRSGTTARIAAPVLATFATVLALHEVARRVDDRFAVGRRFV